MWLHPQWRSLPSTIWIGCCLKNSVKFLFINLLCLWQCLHAVCSRHFSKTRKLRSIWFWNVKKLCETRLQRYIFWIEFCMEGNQLSMTIPNDWRHGCVHVSCKPRPSVTEQIILVSLCCISGATKKA